MNHILTGFALSCTRSSPAAARMSTAEFANLLRCPHFSSQVDANFDVYTGICFRLVAGEGKSSLDARFTSPPKYRKRLVGFRLVQYAVTDFHSAAA